jgi:hypothetical protein
MEHENPLSCLQMPSSEPYHEPVESSQRLHTLFLKDPF